MAQSLLPEPRPWEPWEARRAKAPPGLPLDVREARSDAKLLLWIARERLKLGELPLDLAERLAGAGQDERLTSRRRLMAADVLARLRAGAMRAAAHRHPRHG
jgi:hypothetical protein